MNEKTKKILRYVACGLGGVALGIGLLGGLAMCASSGKSAKAESVNTIYAAPKRAVSTDENGLTMRSFTIPTHWQTDTTKISYGYGVWDPETASVGDWHNYTTLNNALTTPTQVVNYIEDRISGHQNASLWQNQTTRFYYFTGRSSLGDNASNTSPLWCYMTFAEKDNRFVSNGENLPEDYLLNWDFTDNSQVELFAMRTNYARGSGKIFTRADYNRVASNKLSWQTTSRSDYLLFVEDPADLNTEWIFTDAKYHYQSQGYLIGHNEGEQEGYQSGYETGHETGYNEGVQYGLSYGREFTHWLLDTHVTWPSYGWSIYEDAPAGMYGEHNPQYWEVANLFRYTNEEDYVKQIYLLMQKDDGQSGFRPCYIAQYDITNESLDSATIAVGTRYTERILEADPDFNLHIFWTSGNDTWYDIGLGKATMVDNHAFTDGYILLKYNEAESFDQELWDQAYLAGQMSVANAGSMDNVFSLFADAFDAVGGFFNLKVFGFLPLYWFFLVPLFVAIITLLLRMVKH